jgi:hypothetical protein
VVRVARLAADEVEDVRAAHAAGLALQLGQRRQHRRVLGRLAERGVLALGVEDDRRRAAGLQPRDQPGDGRRLAATGRAEDRGVPRQHLLAADRHGDLDLLVPDDPPEPQLAAQPQRRGRLVGAEREDGAVGQRPVARRDQLAAGQLLAEQLDVDPPVVARHQDRAAHGRLDDERRVGPQPVRLGERSLDDDPEVAPLVLLADDPHERLRGHQLDRLLRQQHRHRAVLARRRVEGAAAERLRLVVGHLVGAARSPQRVVEQLVDPFLDLVRPRAVRLDLVGHRLSPQRVRRVARSGMYAYGAPASA